MSAGHEPSGPGRRAVVRWAWRLFRREWRQQVLVLALVTVAVAAATSGATIVDNAASSVDSRFGAATGIVHLEIRSAAQERADLAAARRRFGPVEVITHGTTAVAGSAEPLDVRSQDPTGRFGHPLLGLRHGRYPVKEGDEVALTDGAADLLSARIGSRVRVGRTDRTVVGIVENPRDLHDEFALLPPGDDAAATNATLLITAPADRPAASTTSRTGGGSPAGPSGPDFGIEARGNDHAAVAAVVLVAMTLAMVLVGLVAVAGFVVIAQRRQRQLGLLAAIGATQRHLRMVVTANGAIVGAAAALLGGAIGIVGWVIGAPSAEVAAGHRIDRFDLPWALVGSAMGLAVVMATLAAWWPARTTAGLPVMQALSARPARPQAVHRSVAVAIVLLGAGMAGIAAARTTGNVRPLPLVAGVVALVLGVVFASPAAIRMLAVPARHLPFATRLALRDLVRYQARAAASIAAITLGLGISVTVVVLAQSNVHGAAEGNLSSRQLVIDARRIDDGPVPVGAPLVSAAQTQAVQRIAATLGRSALYPLTVALSGPVTGRGQGPVVITVARQLDAHSFRGVDRPFVASPALLRRFGIDPATIGPDVDLITRHTGRLTLLDPTTRQGGTTVVEHRPLSPYTSAPSSLIPPSALRRHGWTRLPVGWFLEASKPLTHAQVVAARHAAAAAGLTVESRSSQDDLKALRTGATATGALLALAIVAMTIGLIRSEADRDVRTLTATGAAPRTRRMVTASTAGAVALLGALLGMLGAYAALGAAFHTDPGRLAGPPFTNLLELAVGLPLVAAVAGWLLAGRDPKTFSRQALD